MDTERLPFTFVLVLFFGAFLLFHPFVDCRELRREATCYSDTLHLDCGKSVIAIHEAYFTSARQENHTCHSPEPPSEHDYIEDNADAEAANDSVCHQDIRVSLNRKCSGFKSCNYSYSQQPEKSCSSPEGLSIVRFDCVRESSIDKYCNSKITSPEGYIASPGYPQYYPQLSSCTWSLSASDGQTIFASILHLHIQEAVDVTPTMTSPEQDYHVMGQLVEDAVRRCDNDWLRIVEGVVKKVEVCGDGEEGLKSVEVDGVAGMEVRFRSVAFMPDSGFLMYYKVQGCPTIPAGPDITLVDRNGSAAVYACRLAHQVFNDTLEGTRFLTCVRDHHWNDTLPPCVSLEDTASTIPTTVSSLEVEEEMKNSSMAANEKMNPHSDHTASLVIDIIIPCVIIGVLFVVNSLVLVIIFAIRRRQKPIEGEFEGLDEQPPPIVSEEIFEEESPQTSLRDGSEPTVSKKVDEQSPQTSLNESESHPSVSQETKESESQPTVSQEAKGSESQPTVSQEAKGSESQPTVSQEAKGSESQPTISQEAKESESQPTVSQESKESESQPTVSQESKGSELQPTASQEGKENESHASVPQESKGSS